MNETLDKKVETLTEQQNIIKNEFYNVVLNGDYKTANKLAKAYKKIDSEKRTWGKIKLGYTYFIFPYIW